MISSSSILTFAGMIAIGLILPVLVSAIWIKKTKQPIVTILIGAAIFFGFAIILETIPKLLLFQTNNPVGRYVMNHVFLYMTIAALLAGIFEETGRLIAFKFLLKKETKKETAVTYGIGHGGFEAMYLLVLGGIQNLMYAVMINTGQFDKVVEQIRVAAPEQLETIESIPSALAAVGPSTLFLSGMERVSAMMIHIACSIIMFWAVRGVHKMWLYVVAIVLHASIDMIAALYQCGYITNLFVMELCLIAWAAAFLVITVRLIYNRIDTTEEKLQDEKPQEEETTA